MSWQVASPIILSAVVYNRQLPGDLVNAICETGKPVKQQIVQQVIPQQQQQTTKSSSSSGGWGKNLLFWGSSSTAKKSTTDVIKPINADENDKKALG